MSTAVATGASDVGLSGSTILAGVGAAVLGGVYLAGWNIKNLSTATLALSAIILAIVLWLLLTDVNKLSKLVVDNQLVALALACVVGLELMMHAGVLLKYPSFNMQ